MKVEMKEEILQQLDSNYALIRDEDWEVLCLLWRDSEGYYVLYMEHYNLTKDEANQLLDKSAWIALIPVVDEEIKKLYKKELLEQKKKTTV